MSLGVIGFDFQSPPKLILGILKVASLSKRTPQMEASFSVVRIELKGHLEFGNSAYEIPFLV